MQPLAPVNPNDQDVVVALAYAGADNFTGKPVYRRDAGCWLHGDALAPLSRAVAQATALGLRLRILDAFRPTEAQWRLWNHTPDPEFLADPRIGSQHSRGAAVDLDLVDRLSGEALDMGTAFDAFTPQSHHARTDLPREAQRNRLVLMGLMVGAGWVMNPLEWWHYELPEARTRYPLISDSLLGAARMMAP